jgi:hypothetical protein
MFAKYRIWYQQKMLQILLARIILAKHLIPQLMQDSQNMSETCDGHTK